MKERMWKKTIAGFLAAACLLPLGAPALAAGESAGVTDGLVGYWTFDGNSQDVRLTNQAADSAITASPAGTAAAQADGGIHGGAVYFDGADNSPLKLISDAGQGLNAKTADFTLAAWVKYDADMDSSYNSNLFQLTGIGRTILYVAPNGKYVTYLTADEVAMSTTAPVGGRWHHVALTWDHTAKTMACYINGTQEVSATLTGDPADAATDVWVGTHKSNAHQAIKGYVDELRYYTRALSQEDVTALYTYEGYNEIAEAAAELHILVDPDTVVREITPAMFGINHRYHKNGYGTWDAEAKKVNEDFNAMVKDGGFGSVRWPGGTVSNLFTWKDSIGPLESRTPTIAGNNFYSDAGEVPVEPGFGLDEAAKWICDDLGVEMIYVYGMGRGSAQDAADLVEYLNAPNDGSNPGGGTDWAAVRAENGHPAPYNVTKFEIGNEFTDVGQNYWATPKGGNNDAQAVEDYIMGGRRDFAGETQYYQHNDRVVKKGDWRKDASFSDGEANEERYLCYVPVIANTATIYVNGEQWQIVDSLEGQGAANVCTLDYETGKITFGDGTNGNIPPRGQQITAHYSSDRDGFAAYSDAMKAVAGEIRMEIKIYSGVHDSLQSSFITKMHEKGYDSKYDGVIYHPYGGSYTEATYEDALTKARSFAATIGTLKNQMDTTTNTTNKEVAVSEFGLNASVDFTKSLGNAIYAADFMIDCVNRGAAYLNRHCLVDFTVGDNLGAWEQAVIQCLGSASSDVSANTFISTPSAQVFSIFNYMTGNAQVEYTATGNDNYATGNSQTVQKVNIYTTKDTGGSVYVLVVNNQKSDTQKLHLALKDEDLTGREIEVWSLTSESVMDQNTQSEPDKVAVQKSQVTADGESLTYTLAAHSITSLKLAPASAPVDTGELEAAIAAANEAKNTEDLAVKAAGTTADQVDKGVSFVTQDAADTLAAAIAAAQAALDAAASQEAVDTAAATLTAAVNAFNGSIKTGTKETAQPPAGPTYNVSGTVTDSGNAAVAGAEVRLMQGSTQVGETATTGAEGLFSFDGVKPGVYNIVAAKDGVTMTKLVTVTDADLAGQTLTMPDGNVSSVLDVKPNTPDVVVGGLEQEAAANAVENSAVTVTMTVETKEETDADTASDVAKIKETASGKTLAFLAITVEKQVDDAEAQAIEETANLLTIVIPFDKTGKKDVTVYRCHGDAAEALTTNPNADGEYFAVSDAAVTVYAKKFSTYAIGYTAETTTPVTPSRPVTVIQPAEEASAWPFVDVAEGDWFFGSVKYAYEKGLMEGTSGTTFAPNLDTSRAMVATILWRLAGRPETENELIYLDCGADSWYAKAVAWASEQGVVKGYGNGSFGPDDPITREQLAAMLYRYAGSPATGGTLEGFVDGDRASDYALEALHWAVEQGILQGKGGKVLDPTGKAARAEAAAMLQRFCEREK